MDVFVLGKVSNFDDQGSARKGWANEVTLQSGATKNKRGFGKSIQLLFVDHDVHKATTADSSREVYRESGIGEAFKFQKAFDLDKDGTPCHILFLVEVKTSCELPANGAESDPGSVRSREG